MRLWKEHFLRNSLESEDHYKIYEETLFPEDNLMIEFKTMKMENTVLKKSTNEMMGELSEIRIELNKYKEKFGFLI